MHLRIEDKILNTKTINSIFIDNTIGCTDEGIPVHPCSIKFLPEYDQEEIRFNIDCVDFGQFCYDWQHRSDAIFEFFPVENCDITSWEELKEKMNLDILQHEDNQKKKK